MGKVEINNEIVSLRHTVRQARVCIVNKLIREAKLLRDKNGTESQLEKNKRKADKLIAEVYALKTIKDDEISKFGIMNEKETKDVLQNQSSSNKDRIIARVAGYKSLNRRLMQFKERFPDYKMYLTEGKKKTTKLKKNAAKSKKSSTGKNLHSQHENSKKEVADSDETDEDSKKQSVNRKMVEGSQHNSTGDETCETRSCKTKDNLRKRRKPSNEDAGAAKANNKLPKLAEDNMSEDANKQPSAIKLCSITKEGTVKRFVELLEEQDSTRDAQTSAESTDYERTASVQAKPVDDFFITGSGKGSYQENRTTASTSHTRFDTPARTLRSNSRVKTQSAGFKDNVSESKTPKNDQFKRGGKMQSRGGKMAERGNHPDKQSSDMRQEKRTSNRINKNANKNNLGSNTNDEEKNANLHPSWLAKKKQQEVMSQGFQGKKIVFADD